jgi:hypothetical protein
VSQTPAIIEAVSDNAIAYVDSQTFGASPNAKNMTRSSQSELNRRYGG